MARSRKSSEARLDRWDIARSRPLEGRIFDVSRSRRCSVGSYVFFKILVIDESSVTGSLRSTIPLAMQKAAAYSSSSLRGPQHDYFAPYYLPRIARSFFREALYSAFRESGGEVKQRQETSQESLRSFRQVRQVCLPSIF